MNNNKQSVLSMMLGLGLAGTLCAQKGITQGEALQLRHQFEQEMIGLQRQTEMGQGESKHVVKPADVVALEVRQEQAKRQPKQKGVRKQNVNPRSPQQKAEIDKVLKEFNARLPEVNASLAQVSSNSTLPKIVLKPMTAEGVLASADKRGGASKSVEQQALNQMVLERIQEEMKQADPATRSQMKAVFKAAEQGKSLPLPPKVPPPQQTQILPKGSL